MNAFDLYYGDPGSGKSRSIITLIQKIKADTGKNARVYIGDGSRAMYENSGLVDEGVIKLMEFDIREQPFTTCQQICEGFWPTDVDDPNSKMVKLTQAQVEDTGVWVWEGASVMGDYIMGDTKGGLAQRSADGETIGQDAPMRIIDPDNKDKDGKIIYAFGVNAPSHYNLGQRHLNANIKRTKSFPGFKIWTAHEKYDDGERGGSFAKSGPTQEKYKMTEKIIGPGLIVKGATALVSRDFGNTLHFVTAGKKAQGKQDEKTGKTMYQEQVEHRVYTKDHYDPGGDVPTKYRAVNRSMYPDKIKLYYASDAPGEALLQFYHDLKAAKKL